MIIIGLNSWEINSSVALFKDGRIIAGAPEERFNRQKLTREFPDQALRYCLEFSGNNIEDVDYVAQAWNPGIGWTKFNPIISRHRSRSDYFYSLPDCLFNYTTRTPKEWVCMQFPEDSPIPPVYYVSHHLTHAANAFFLSPFEEAAILTADWKGELDCLNSGTGKGSAINIDRRQTMPNSLGMFYATFTELLGFRPDSDEWKVMALSAFDAECEEQVRKVRSTIHLSDDGLLELDQSYYKGGLIEQPELYTNKLVQLLGGRVGQPGENENQPDDWTISTAKAMQTVSEEIMSHFLNNLYERTKLPKLVVGGGFFMNSVYNGKVLDQTPFKEVYTSYAPSDVGNSIGAAQYVAHCIHDLERDNFSDNSSFIGPCYERQEIINVLNRRKIHYQDLSEPERTVAELIASGEVVAHFHGRMEFGDRALGNRSILADPRDPTVKNRINSMIKYREPFRPFAPAVLAESAHKYFEVNPDYKCLFMEKVVPVRSQFRSLLPGTTHVDGSSRLQTVSKKDNDRFYRIIEETAKLTSYPIVLNTSFNINGEPIVLSPDDALNTFFNSGLRHLVLGSILVTKN
jgi:carbamoyltransferase